MVLLILLMRPKYNTFPIPSLYQRRIMAGTYSKLGLLVVVVCLIQTVMTLGTKFQLVEQLDKVPEGWTRGEKPSSSTVLKLRLAVDQPNLIALEQDVVDISTPGHPRYGQHMKRDELKERLRPGPAVSSKIVSWLNAENISRESTQVDGNWFTFKATVLQAERMLNTKFSYFRHEASGATVIRTLGYSVPEDIHPHVLLIQPTTRFGNMNTQRSLPIEEPIEATQADLAAPCGLVVSPDCLREMYGLYGAQAKPDPRNRLGISGFLEQFARHGDFDEFISRFAYNQTDANFTVVSINGGLNDENSSLSSTEASLDVQYSITLAYNALATYYTTAGRGPLVPDGDQPSANNSTNEPYLEQLLFLLNLPDDKLPAVLTTSYGESEQSLPASYANVTCNLFAQLGGRGVSVIFSSGDSGPGSSCRTNDGTNRRRFLPGFPASCPFVTGVGATYSSGPEKATDFSGGGFSDIFARPDYQHKIVDDYLKNLGNQWKGLYNPKGRGIPDVAAQGSNFLIRDHGRWLRISGTRFVSLKPDRSEVC